MKKSALDVVSPYSGIEDLIKRIIIRYDAARAKKSRKRDSGVRSCRDMNNGSRVRSFETTFEAEIFF